MHKLFFIFLLLPTFAFSQKTGNSDVYIHPIDSRLCKSNFQTVRLGSSNPDDVISYLVKTNSNLISENNIITVKLISKIESPGGVHLLFQQLFNGVDVYRAQVKVNMDKKGNITSILDNTFNVNSSLPSDFPDSSVAFAYMNRMEGGEKSVDHYKVEKNYFFDNDTFLPSLRLEVSEKNCKYFEVILSKSGQIIYQRDLNSYYHSKVMADSIVPTNVFLPDPLTTAGVTYGAPYIDDSDNDVSQLNAQRVAVNIKVDYTNDTFRLQGPYAIITECSTPTIPPVFYKTTPNFIYTRSQSGFEDVNAYYHITSFQDYIQGLGFTNLGNQIWVDTHALDDSDNSLFNPGYSPPRLLFGEGGVDDAEDADVIIHEYGHAISYCASSGTNSGYERETIDEGDGDYLASSYSRSINPYLWENVFSWDGHNEFWSGRSTSSTKHYPQDFINTGSIYKNADIWSATLMEIWGDIGRIPADKILFETMYGFGVGMTMTDAAALYIKADTLLYGGAHYNAICNRFYNRGLSTCTLGFNEIKPELSLQLINSAGFSDGTNALVRFSKSSSALIKILDVQGKMISSESVSNITECQVNGRHLSSGMYILNIQTPTNTYNYKLLRF